METNTSNAAQPSSALLAACAAARALEPGEASAPLRQALGVAEILASLAVDDELAFAALATPLLAGGLLTEDAAIQRFGTGAVRLAHELAQLGSFGLPTQWNPNKKLSAGQSETLRKMLLAIVTDPRLVLLRLAGQLYLLRESRHRSPEEQQRIALDAREIYAPLANRLGVWQIKWELEDLAFRQLDPENYRRIAGALKQRRLERESSIESARAQLEAELKQAGVKAEVAGRPKHIFSIFRKMQRKHLDFEQVMDVRALRVMVDSVPDCYAALGVVHGLWPNIPGEFDDYIATPKENHYRSLHTAVYGPNHEPFEVQIRTREMHAHAELGVAAHWKYKEGGTRDAAYEAKINSLRQLLLPTAQEEHEDDFIERVRAAIFQDRVYALSPKGDVIELPQGATPLDFAYYVHTDIGHRTRGAKVNGRMVQLNHPLKSGDVVEILTGKLKQPNRDWMSQKLGFLLSSRNRGKVRAWFRKLDEEEAPPPEQTEPAPARVIPAPRKPRKPAAPNDVIIEGLGDLPSNLARCCSPRPPDEIVGYLTVTRGVIVHKRDCLSLQRMRTHRPQRVFTVEWGAQTRETKP